MEKNPNYVPVADNPHLVRDTQTNAILSTNKDGLEQYKKQREERLRIKQMLNDFDDMRKDLKELKELMLASLTQK